MPLIFVLTPDYEDVFSCFVLLPVCLPALACLLPTYLWLLLD